MRLMGDLVLGFPSRWMSLIFYVRPAGKQQQQRPQQQQQQ